MNNPTSLSSFRSQKKYKKLIEDIDSILKVFDLTQRSLVHFKYIIAAQEIISILETNKTILALQQKELKKEIT